MSGQLTVSGIFFDAGDTLVRPASGHWYIPPRFSEILAEHSLARPDESALISALESGYPYLNANHNIQTEIEELRQFTEYFRIVLSHPLFQGYNDSLAPELAEALAQDMVYNDGKFVFFDDTAACIRELKQANIPIGILSNTWPSLERVFANVGMYDIFDVFVVSSKVGCFKPAMRIYHEAIQGIGMAPETLLFVDDSDDNLASGVKAGMQVIKISRYGNCSGDEYRCVTNLRELHGLIT